MSKSGDLSLHFTTRLEHLSKRFYMFVENNVTSRNYSKFDNVRDLFQCACVRCCIIGQMDDEEQRDGLHHKLHADSTVSFYNAYNRTLKRVRHLHTQY